VNHIAANFFDNAPLQMLMPVVLLSLLYPTLVLQKLTAVLTRIASGRGGQTHHPAVGYAAFSSRLLFRSDDTVNTHPRALTTPVFLVLSSTHHSEAEIFSSRFTHTYGSRSSIALDLNAADC
jgi:hypothetical protein